MLIVRRYQQLFAAATVLILVFLSLSIGQQTLEILGYSVQSLGSLIEFVKLLLLIAVGLFIFLMLGTTLIGYLVITGWRRHHEIPGGIKLLASLLVGTVIVVLSAPLGLFLPIPLLPTAITAITAWYLLRKLSEHKVDTNCRRPTITEIEESASRHLRTKAAETDPIRTLDLQLNDNEWDGLFLAGKQGTPYRLKIEADNATVISCEKVA